MSVIDEIEFAIKGTQLDLKLFITNEGFELNYSKRFLEKIILCSFTLLSNSNSNSKSQT